MRPFLGLAPPIFVVQKHKARSLHYDFRLEINGTLVSWAIPKGPSLSPKDKRLAIRVGDHSLSYGEFEGRLRAGEHGAGTVIVWDYGRWEPIGDSERGLGLGELEFLLHGKKLKGKWSLVRFGHKGPKEWLLIKTADDQASEVDSLIQFPRSALTERTLEEVDGDPRVPELRCEDFG